MVNVNEIKVQMIRKKMTAQDVYTRLGISKKMWYDRMSKGRFNSDEMYALIKILDIDDPSAIFFAENVT